MRQSELALLSIQLTGNYDFNEVIRELAVWRAWKEKFCLGLVEVLKKTVLKCFVYFPVSYYFILEHINKFIRLIAHLILIVIITAIINHSHCRNKNKDRY